MKTRLERFGEGPWLYETDRAEWSDRGYPCLVLRHQTMGHLAGYIAVPEGHPWHGRHYDDVDVDVHGGLTYGSQGNDRIKHKDAPPNAWYFGFDCAHSDDHAPGLMRTVSQQFRDAFPQGTYRNLDYVRDELARLVQQADRDANNRLAF